MDFIESYNKYFAKRSFERRDLIEKIVEKYNIKSAIYPGSYTHVTLSIYIPSVIYVDTDKTTIKIFEDIDDIIKFIKKNKKYSMEPEIVFIGKSYQDKLPIKKKVDFLFSQYAGPISLSCKKYLKKGGILVVNNSHADAGIAFLDPGYSLIGVAKNRGGKVTISEKNLHEYFIPKKQQLTMEELLKSGKGIGYTKTADNYIFRKTK